MTGIERGVQYLSNANAVAAVLLVFFLFVVGPTVFIMDTFTESLGGYLTHLPTMAFSTGVSLGGDSCISSWTIFYWAWWISWTPFVGMFIARISKGRTIRQFVVYVILVPSLVSFVWFSIMAGARSTCSSTRGQVRPRGGTGEMARKVRSSTRCGSTRGPHHGGAGSAPDRDLLHHRGRRGLDRDGDAQPARQGGAEPVARHLLGCRDQVRSPRCSSWPEDRTHGAADAGDHGGRRRSC